MMLAYLHFDNVMEAEFTVPGLVTTIGGIVGLVVTVVQLKEHPKTRGFLLLIIIGIVILVGWYVSPSVISRTPVFNHDRQQSKQLDDKVAKAAQEIVDIQQAISLAKEQAELYEQRKHAIEAQREMDLAALEEVRQKQAVEALQKATQERTLLDIKTAVQGVWKCGPYKFTWVFNQDGTLTLPIASATYEVLDATHVKVAQFGSSVVYDLSLNGTEQTLGNWSMTCRRPRP